MKKISKKQMVKAAKVSARLGGCTCDPDVTITAESGTGVYAIGVAHDAWCGHRLDDPGFSEKIDHAIRSLGYKQ